MRKRAIGWMISLAILIACFAGVASAQSVPTLINYQGKLTDATGQPLPTADYTLSVSIYAAPCSVEPCGDTPVWGPQEFDGEAGPGHGAVVPVVQGYFNVMLGSVDINGDSILNAFNEQPRYVEVTVGSGAPILPRQQVLSAPFAIRALSGGGEIGDIVMSSLTESQFNDRRGGGEWVLCDGRDVTGSTFHEITGTANVPDLRGRVAVGAGDGPSTSSRPLGATGGAETHTLTVAEIPPHTHTYQHYWDAEPIVDEWGTPVGDGTGHGATFGTGSTGGNQAHNNMQPFMAVNFFVRIN